MDNEVGTVCEPALGQHVRGTDNDDVDTKGRSEGTRREGSRGQGHEGSNQTRAAPTHRVLKVVLKSRYALFSNMSRRMAEGGGRGRWSTWACKSRLAAAAAQKA
jgi:hypothetical protein